jgi:hypothetical protein
VAAKASALLPVGPAQRIALLTGLAVLCALLLLAARAWHGQSPAATASGA